ncbi:hypothetical protein [Paraconexibacter sp. AEG42_29]|uniref:hypothetical protein n=1 Tax=Paraconexibacter sp. AEG42_29 TaxID=2997339 RepID=UPI00339D803D
MSDGAFDVGRGSRGRAVVVWTQGCDGPGRCLVQSVALTGGRPRTIARLPDGARSPVAIDGTSLVYVADAAGCNELRLLTLPGGPDSSLGRGTCGSVLQVDVDGSFVAAAVSTEPPGDEDSFPSEAWLSDVRNGGVRIAQVEDAGYSGPDQITQVMLDRGALFTTRLGDSGDQLVRIPVNGGAATRTRVAGSSPAVVARDAGTTYVIDAVKEGRRSALLQYRLDTGR